MITIRNTAQPGEQLRITSCKGQVLKNRAVSGGVSRWLVRMMYGLTVVHTIVIITMGYITNGFLWWLITIGYIVD